MGELVVGGAIAVLGVDGFEGDECTSRAAGEEAALRSCVRQFRDPAVVMVIAVADGEPRWGRRFASLVAEVTVEEAGLGGEGGVDGAAATGCTAHVGDGVAGAAVLVGDGGGPVIVHPCFSAVGQGAAGDGKVVRAAVPGELLSDGDGVRGVTVGVGQAANGAGARL